MDINKANALVKKIAEQQEKAINTFRINGININAIPDKKSYKEHLEIQVFNGLDKIGKPILQKNKYTYAYPYCYEVIYAGVLYFQLETAKVEDWE